ncbi:MOSC domain-containing protein [Glycomyces xiaoerkulensis]|uniref:MOSC domain-containing protein n=1 Tax=Glycomyces xiaoerkulensis TaxID=2038139 RepID=UPI001300037E|nr:MOSC domain-containing protein [Glycomyces xiaoerkulensis]
MFAGTVTRMWRWPVKGLRGETVRSATVGPAGMAGDRVLRVLESGTGERLWGGGLPRMMGWEAAWPAQCGSADGTGDAPVLYEPGGAPWAADDPGLPERLASDLALERGVELRPNRNVDRILVIFEASLKRLEEELGRAVEPERFRPNVMVETDADPFAELELEPGTAVRLGEAELGVQEPCERCVLPSWDPYGRERDRELHRLIVGGHRNLFGLYLKTSREAPVRLGDPVTCW